MVIVPCSMSTLGRLATGSGDNALLRTGDVFLKERRKLIVVPRETPWSLIHARNVVTLLEAGAIVLPAIPPFYSRPATVEELADTVVWRILDQLGLPEPARFSLERRRRAIPRHELKLRRLASALADCARFHVCTLGAHACALNWTIAPGSSASRRGSRRSSPPSGTIVFCFWAYVVAAFLPARKADRA